MITAIFYLLWLVFKWLMIFTWYMTKWTFKLFIIPCFKAVLYLLCIIFGLAEDAIGLPFTIIAKLIPDVR